MKLFLVEREDDTTLSYEIFTSFVVCAIDTEDAKRFHPEGDLLKDIEEKVGLCFDWPLDSSLIKATEIGKAKENIKRGEIICTSFYNA